MNRRNFFSTLAKATAGFMILPAATTYARRWKQVRHVWVIDWVDTQVGKTTCEYNKLPDVYVLTLDKAWDQNYATFKANGGWDRFKDLPLAKRRV